MSVGNGVARVGSAPFVPGGPAPPLPVFLPTGPARSLSWPGGCSPYLSLPKAPFWLVIPKDFGDRILWTWPSRVWVGWRDSLVSVRPETGPEPGNGVR
jgi:hypothetical protein